MKLRMIKIAAAGAMLAAAVGIPAVNAQQDGAVRAGVLTCEVSGGTGFIFGSSKGLSCVFDSDGDTERYVGEINKFGIDIGVTGPATLSWAVLAPSSNLGEGVLAGSYIGASAEASAGVGAGANLWSEDRTIRSRCSRSACRGRRASTPRLRFPSWS